jgi:hypothetical protein
MTEPLANAKCLTCGAEWDVRIQQHYCGLRKLFEPVSKDWEYQVIERPAEILITIFNKQEENVRGYLRFTSPEEVEQWKPVLESICSKRE